MPWNWNGCGNQADVCVVGGGPAGLAAAIAVRRRGFRVMVLDGARPPIDKSCGEGLMPDGVAALAALGIEVPETCGGRFRGIRFIERGLEAEAHFPLGSGAGVRRTALHRILAEHAARLGIALRWGTQVRALGELRCRWIIGADGQNSRVRRWAGLDAGRSQPQRIGYRRHLLVERPLDCVEVHWADRCQVYLTPVGPREICAALISRDPKLRFEHVPERFPELAHRIARAAPLTPERGAITVMRTLSAVTRGRVALVGDASGSVDAVTGEGLRLAFQQAEALAGALVEGDLSYYEAAHRRIGRLSRTVSRLMLAMSEHSWFRARVLAAFAADPCLFARVLAIHVGARPPVSLGMSGTLSLGWQFLTA